jgi:hypothetical protein
MSDISTFTDLLNLVNIKVLFTNPKDKINTLYVSKEDLVESFKVQSTVLKRGILMDSERPKTMWKVEIDIDTQNKLESAFDKQFSIQNEYSNTE